MALHISLRPIDVARATGISVQQGRNYESWGFLPPASQSKSGYRLSTQQHLAALTTARSLIGGCGSEALSRSLVSLLYCSAMKSRCASRGKRCSK